MDAYHVSGYYFFILYFSCMTLWTLADDTVNTDFDCVYQLSN